MITRPPKIPKHLKAYVLIFMVPVSLFFLFFHHAVVLPIDFSSEAWTSNVPARMNMLHDLLKKNIVMGKTSKELEELLGEPDGNPRHGGEPDTYYYRLQKGDLVKNGKYIELIGFKTKNDRVVGVIPGIEKYW